MNRANLLYRNLKYPINFEGLNRMFQNRSYNCLLIEWKSSKLKRAGGSSVKLCVKKYGAAFSILSLTIADWRTKIDAKYNKAPGVHENT